MTHHEEAEAAVRTMSGLGVRAVRLLFTDLHGVARGKDIPIGHFGGMVRRGRCLLRRRDGHRPAPYARRRGRGGLRRLLRPPRPEHPARRPLEPGGGLVPRGGLDARRLRPLRPRARARSCSGSSTPTPSGACARSWRRSSSSSSPCATPTGRTGCAATWTSTRASTPSAPSPTRKEIVLQDAALVRRARPAGLRREPRVHELAVRDQRQALRRARRRRPRLHAEGGGEGDRGAGGVARDVHGPAVRRPGRLGLPPPPLARGRERPQRLRRRRRSGGTEPARRQLHRGPDRARAGPAGAARADDQRLQADPARQPGADPRELGPRQPHRVRARPERARLAGPHRGAHGRRRRLPAPDHGGAPARRAGRDRAEPDPARAGRRRLLPPRRRPCGLDAAVRPRGRARRARGRHGADRRSSATSSCAPSWP